MNYKQFKQTKNVGLPNLMRFKITIVSQVQKKQVNTLKGVTVNFRKILILEKRLIHTYQ